MHRCSKLTAVAALCLPGFAQLIVPPAVADDFGAFVVGEGSYRAEVLVEDDEGRTCHVAWPVQARRTGSERQLQAATPPGTVEPLDLQGPKLLGARGGPRIARLTI